MIPALQSLPELFGSIDIYLFDQLLKGRVREGMKLLDAGCGEGRNIGYLLQAGVKVYGADASDVAIREARQMAAKYAPEKYKEHFAVADLAALPYQAANFDVVICSAVLHFARNEAHFRSMFQELWRVLQPGGMLFCRFSTTIGMEGKLIAIGPSLYQMPNGPVWFLADEPLVRELVYTLEAEMLEPLKTVLVEDKRSMTTLVLRKNS
ncbi:class I SAM-dependent methyltransferase [Pontibacter oryzae]|uniref:Class I SAM-dependent methyltransferase n=1 Tax=Pontibacter oryzae TaxID=2304593 RepID=A0A399SKC2_9BACT|nr:class I SAM-dependent methyltransferase [Pontibacter oryzae]RIJ42367.1 class I SAM-dependent methyltransferase [Pontibacter oryzae]